MTLLNILSALKENEAYLDSIQGRIDLFNNSVQTMWMNFMDTDAVKFIVDLGTGLIELIDKLGMVRSLVIAIVGYMTLTKKLDWVGFGKGFSETFAFLKNGQFKQAFSNHRGFDLLGGKDLAKAIEDANQALAAGGDELKRYKQNQDNVKSGMVQYMNTANGAKLTAEGYTLALQNQSRTAVSAQLKQTLLNAAISVGVMVLTAAIGAIQEYIKKTKDLASQYDEITSSISSLESEIGSIDSELENIQKQISALTGKKLTLTEANELRRLREQSAELQRQKELQQDLLAIRKEQQAAKSLSMYNSLLKTTAANQEKAASAWKTVGTILGTVIGLAASAAAIYFSSGTATAAASAIVTGASAAGGAAGGAIGKWAGSKSKEVDSLTEWYESYQTAIEEAEKKAIEAENKYLSNTTQNNYDKWQKKVEAANKLKEELYTGIEEMQEYINNIEYEGNEAIVDDFNQLMVKMTLETDDGSMESQMAAITSLQDEFAELSKGVDENGKNIALSADEYSRYNAIVQQVLGYNTGMISSFDAQGNAILRAGDATYSYNQLLEQSLALMKDQAKMAAQELVSDENIVEAYNASKNNNTYSERDFDKALPMDIVTHYEEELPNGETGTFSTNWNSQMSEDVVLSVLGLPDEKTFLGIGNSIDSIQTNIVEIVNRRDEILAQLKESMLAQNIPETEADNYVQEYSKFIDDMYSMLIGNVDKIRSDFAHQLYTVFQGTDAYYEMDGSQVAFVNSWIEALTNGIDNIESLSEEEILQYKQTVESFAAKLGESEVGQEFINQLFTIDPNVSVKTYREMMNKIFDQLISEGVIDEATRNKLIPLFFPDLEKTDEMFDVIKQKLTDSAQYFADTLNAGEIKILYKYVLEKEDGSITAEEARAQISEAVYQGEVTQTYSIIAESVEKFKDVVAQTSEILVDGVTVTEDYKTALTELGISETDLSECFDETNPLIVTNADALNKLVKSSKNSAASNTKLAKSQARLKYINLYKQIRSLTKGQTTMTKGTLNQIKALYSEMGILQKTIHRYELLEEQLLGTTDAFTKFEEAQQTDEETNYTGKLADMMLTLGKAFNTAELGSEAAQAAIMALVPPSVYEDLDTLDEKMAAIYEYFRNGTLSKYFTIQYDDDGNIESAEMKLANIKNFVEAGKEAGVFSFEGDNWQHFDLTEDINSLEEFADQMDITKEMAFAFFEALEKYDINWLGGDYSTLFDELTPSASEIDDLEKKIQKQFDDSGVKIDVAVIPRMETSTLQDAGYTTKEGQNTAVETLSHTDTNGVTSYYNYMPVVNADGTIVNKADMEKQITDQLSSGLDHTTIKVNGMEVAVSKYDTKEAAEKAATQLEKDTDSYVDKKANYSIESDLYNTTIELADKETKRAEILSKDVLTEEDSQKVKELNTEIEALNDNLDLATQKAYENWKAYTVNDAALASLEAVDDKTEELTREQRLTLGIDDASIATVQDAITYLLREKYQLEEPTEMTMQFVADNLFAQIDETKAILESGDPVQIAVAAGTITQEEVDSRLAEYREVYGRNPVDIPAYLGLDVEENKAKLESNLAEMEDNVGVIVKDFNVEIPEDQKEAVDQYLKDTQELVIGDKIFKVVANGASETLTVLQNIADLKFPDKEQTIKVNVVQQQSTITGTNNPKPGNAPKSSTIGQAPMVNGTARVNGTAYKGGSWGAPKTEEALVGELGAEMRVRDGRWELIGENGAEFTDVQKGDIIFNHRQTESLLKNGYVTGRGKAYAGGTAYNDNDIVIWPHGASDTAWQDTDYYDGIADDLSDAASDLSDAADEFREVFDWIEVRIEEIDEKISLLEASLENAAYYNKKNNIIDSIIDLNNTKLSNLKAGYEEYAEYAAKLLIKIPENLRDAAQNGAIAIEKFVGEADEATVEAINNYREWAQKAADLKQQAEEIISTIRDLAIDKFNNAKESGDVRITVEDSQTEKLQNAVDLIEDKGMIANQAYYTAMMENSNKKIEYQTAALKAAQKAFDDAVKAGQIKRGSNEWYELIDELYQMQSVIDESTAELEEFQNAINDIYWDNFDELINRIDYLNNQTQSLIDLMDSADIVTKPEGRTYEGGTVKFWTADDVQWTKEGIATLGLYAQQMEIAEYKARQYAEAIDDLQKDYQKGLYSENEYLEKLDELTQNQYDAIESFEDAKKAIVDLNEAYVENVKDGIQAQIDAYDELIQKRKDELSAEKD